MNAHPRLRLRIGLSLLCAAVLGLAGAGRPAAAGEPDAVPLLEPDAAVSRALGLADARLSLMPAVAAAKWRAGQPVGDPAREAVVVRAAADRAARVGLSPDPVARLAALQIRLARQRQDELFGQWRRQGFDRSAPDRSLATDLRPRIDRLADQWIQALYLAAPSLAQGNVPGRYAEAARTLLPAPRWSASARTELLVALAEVHFATPRSLARARAAGVLRIGTPGDYAPFAVAADGGVSGADIALALRLAQALALKPVLVRTSWKDLLADLGSDRFDIAVGGISVTPSRLAAAAFSLPVAHGGKTAIGRCADRARFASLAAIDRPAVRVVENPGGTNEAFARSTLHSAALFLHADNRTVFAELIGGHADVMFTDDTEIALATRRQPELCRLLPELYAPADKAFLLPREPEWAAAVDGWLQPALERGEPGRVLAGYLDR
jgi:cyclohexadienyl dehydratase